LIAKAKPWFLAFLWLHGLLLCSYLNAAEDRTSWISAANINLPPHATKAFLLSDIPIDMEVIVTSQNTVVSRQNGPQSRLSNEFVVLETGSAAQSFTIYVVPAHHSEVKLQWSLVELPSDVSKYQLLHQALVLWYEADFDPRRQALVIVEAVFRKAAKGSNLYFYSVQLYAHMLAQMEKLQKAHDLIEQVRLEKVDIPKLIDRQLLWLQANAMLLTDQRQKAVELHSMLLEMFEDGEAGIAIQLFKAEIQGNLGLAMTLNTFLTGDKSQLSSARKLIEQGTRMARQHGDIRLLSNLLNHIWTYYAVNNDFVTG
jgi:hypothetical protein